MKVLHVVAGLAESGGGLSELVPRFAREARRCGLNVTIATVASERATLSSAAEAAEKVGVRIVRFYPSFPRPVFYSKSMGCGLAALVHEADIVHVHSNWTFPVWWACRCALRAGRPLVMSPQGCLDPVRLAHSAWKKRLAGLLDRRFLRSAMLIHATSAAEEAWIQRYIGGSPRIVVIPNGVDLPTPGAMGKVDPLTRQVLFLGRLHPLKGIDLLLDAWARVGRLQPTGPPWRLVIAGPDEQGMRRRLEEQARRHGLANVSFIGAVYGADKARQFANTDLFVLPSRSENFGIAVAEALAAGVPVITTKRTPWREIEGSCGWWVEPTSESIATALDAAMRLSDAERVAMGAKGRALVETRYQWPAVGRAMVAAYGELVGPDLRGSG
jgi:glycosyltransferase involved in cell wall biosynthesis